jgi:omega-hydroxy-beta-dihydromenaquinone-9 sulfotransferase
MPWREAFLTRLGPGLFCGITLPVWLRVLRENRFAIDPPYRGRAMMITMSSVPNTLHAWLENLFYGRRIQGAKVHPPIFILGIWRSGTTLLHNLFSQDDRLAFPNNYQVCYPTTFLLTEPLNGKLVDMMIPPKRPQDNMRIGMREPQEDEFAFCPLTGRGFTMGWSFPRCKPSYDRFLTLRQCSDAELAEWKTALGFLIKKLSYKYRKPLVLKSPGHTCRIRILLELFPDARFVHIHRDPYAVFQSSEHTAHRVAPWVALQRPDFGDLDDRTIRQYREVYDAFFEERNLIPAGSFAEVAFEDVERDPVGQMQAIYEALGLPDFAYVEAILQRYVSSISGYRKNAFAPLPEILRERIAHEWRRCFEEWGYPVEPQAPAL